MVALDHLADALCRECSSAFPGQRLLGARLYGSHAAGRSRPDIDVAVLFDEPLDPVSLFDAGTRLAAFMKAPVDLVDLRRAGGLLRVEATQRGRPLVPPTLEADYFTTHAIADHAASAAHRRAATAAMQEKFGAR